MCREGVYTDVGRWIRSGRRRWIYLHTEPVCLCDPWIRNQRRRRFSTNALSAPHDSDPKASVDRSEAVLADGSRSSNSSPTDQIAPAHEVTGPGGATRASAGDQPTSSQNSGPRIPTYDRVAKNKGNDTTNIMHEILPLTSVPESQSTARLGPPRRRRSERN